MKKLVALFLAALLVLSMAACGDTEKTDTNAWEDFEFPTNSVKEDVTEEPEETEAIVETEEEEATQEETTAAAGGMRPEFKEAMDAYEAFYDEYCDFMKKYQANPSDLSLLTEYSSMMTEAADMSEAFAQWDQDEMNSEELKYYLEVSSRVTKKLADVAM